MQHQRPCFLYFLFADHFLQYFSSPDSRSRGAWHALGHIPFVTSGARIPSVTFPTHWLQLELLSFYLLLLS